MTAGDITVTQPVDVGDEAATVAVLSGAGVVGADALAAYVSDGQVWFAVATAA